VIAQCVCVVPRLVVR